MLENLLNLRRRFAIARHRQAPLFQGRERFLEHLHQQGTSLAALRGVSWQLLNVIAQLKLTRLRQVSIREIEEAGGAWAVQQRSNPRAPTCKWSAHFFMYAAKKWLRFAGKLTTPTVSRTRFANRVEDFARWMIEERGMSPLSVRSHCWKASLFLKWFSEKHRPLSAVRLQDVDEFLTLKGTHGWNRTSVAIGAHALRVFFRYAEGRGWCRKGLGDGIESPRLYVHEGLPEGPEWRDVQRLLKSARGGDPATVPVVRFPMICISFSRNGGLSAKPRRRGFSIMGSHKLATEGLPSPEENHTGNDLSTSERLGLWVRPWLRQPKSGLRELEPSPPISLTVLNTGSKLRSAFNCGRGSRMRARIQDRQTVCRDHTHYPQGRRPGRQTRTNCAL